MLPPAYYTILYYTHDSTNLKGWELFFGLLEEFLQAGLWQDQPPNRDIGVVVKIMVPFWVP